MAAGSHLSKDFFELVKTIGEAKSKQEEDRIISAEVVKLKQRMGDPSIKGKLLKEYLIRLIYVEMLGHDASFGYMKAVEVRGAAARRDARARRRADAHAARALSLSHSARAQPSDGGGAREAPQRAFLALRLLVAVSAAAMFSPPFL